MQSPGHGREQVALPARARTPGDMAAFASEQQLQGVRISGLLLRPQIELDHTPTDDGTVSLRIPAMVTG